MNDFKLPKVFDADGDITRRWYVYYSYRNPDDRQWSRFRIYISTGISSRTKRYVKANEIITDLRKKLLSGYNPFREQAQGFSFKMAMKFAVDYKLSCTGKRTSFTYRSIVKLFMKWAKENRMDEMPVATISKNIVRQYFDECLTHERISMRTYNNRLRALKTMFNVLIEREYIEVNPMAGLKMMRMNDAEITAFTSGELKKIAEILPGYNFQLYVISQLIFYCFLRPAELVRLQFRNVLWDDRIILVPGSKSKNGCSESIVMPVQLMNNLNGWCLDHPGEWFLFSSFLMPGSRQISPNRISDHWRTFKKKYGIRKNIYDLKHTGNGIAFDLNLNARDIQLQNRHYSLDQTQQYLNKFRRKASDNFINNFRGY